MEDEVLFIEQQRFRQIWIWIILLGINIYFIDKTIRQLIMPEQLEGKLMSNTGLIVTTLITLSVTLFIACTRLDTTIKDDGIYVRFFPLHLKFRKYSWDKISQAFVRKYEPISEYGGWGYRLGLFGKGRAFNISGNQGIQLIFTDGAKLLIGTNRPAEAKEALDHISILKQ
ncbi:hypothetical protein WG906_05930 [Pedobacter sp. P351]|uniref:hypothetical protein n=1 Tax=Pedobacter superstes TaxID=3133441 RepID=UPI0030B18A62